MGSEEYAFRKKNKDTFLMGILQKERLMLIGPDPVASVPPHTEAG